MLKENINTRWKKRKLPLIDSVINDLRRLLSNIYLQYFTLIPLHFSRNLNIYIKVNRVSDTTVSTPDISQLAT